VTPPGKQWTAQLDKAETAAAPGSARDGHGLTRIARAVGVNPRPSASSSAATPAPSARAARRHRRTLRRVVGHAPPAAPAWSGPRPPAGTRAIAGSWRAAAALDDDLLDTPDYRPPQGWKPATGTGTAPDIRPPHRHHRENRP